MFAVIDCGTTFSRIYIVRAGEIIAKGRKKVGVKDSSLSGSKDVLRDGLASLFFELLEDSGISADKVEFAIASGMISCEDGLMEIPHLVAPVGLEELASGMVKTDDRAILPIPCPVYFVPGIRNSYPEDADVSMLPEIDFMRGEEVQCMGILKKGIKLPCCIVALSSHTKIISVDKDGKIAASMTTISGQFFEALVTATNIGKSIVPIEGEKSGRHSDSQMISAAQSCVERSGLGRTLMMPRFLQVLLDSSGEERSLFANAAIATDDMKAFDDMRSRGFALGDYILYGQKNRCEMYRDMLKQRYGDDTKVSLISDPEELDMLTVEGNVAVAEKYFSSSAAKEKKEREYV